jgi:hypothetical protein
MDSDSHLAAPHGSSALPSRSATPSTSKAVRQKLGSWLRKPFSKSKKSAITEPKPVEAEIAHEQSPQATSMAAPETLLVTTENVDIWQDTVDPARKVVGYELAIAVIDIFQPVVVCTDFVLPTPVGKALETLTKVLGVLKVCSIHDDSAPTNIGR